jgi:hypothetical protein
MGRGVETAGGVILLQSRLPVIGDVGTELVFRCHRFGSILNTEALGEIPPRLATVPSDEIPRKSGNAELGVSRKRPTGYLKQRHCW